MLEDAHPHRGLLASLALSLGMVLEPVCAQSAPASDIEASATAIRCELRTIRAPDATQMLYFYVSDARRTVYETDGNPLGNVVAFTPQRIVVTRNQLVDGGTRVFVFDRLIGSLTVTMQAQSGSREGPWSSAGACTKVDASRPKF